MISLGCFKGIQRDLAPITSPIINALSFPDRTGNRTVGLVIVFDILEDPVDVGNTTSLLILAVLTLLAHLIGVILVRLAIPL